MRYFLPLFICLLCSPLWGANHYVWCAAAGTASGADFTNAFTDLPATLTRGDTYYIAGAGGCTYGAHTFNDAESSTTLISVLHATSAANSGVAGWQASFGTATATWSTSTSHSGGSSIWIIEQGYYAFDGSFGTVGTTEPTSGTFGFHLAKSGDLVNIVYLDGNVNSKVLNNLTFNHIEVDGSPLNFANLVSGANGIIAVQHTGLQSFSTLSLTNSYLHDMETALLQLHAPSNLTVDHNWFARVIYNVTAHGNGVAINPFDGTYSAPNLTFSNNSWKDVCGTSIITVMTGTISNLLIYGNTFFQTVQDQVFPGATTPAFCNGDGQIGDLGTGDGTSNSGGGLTTSASIYNNTFYNCSTSGGCGIFFSNANSTNIVQTDNLFVNNQNLYLTNTATFGCPSGCVDSYNTVLNQQLGNNYTCGGTGDSCQGTVKTITSASVTSNVADVVTSTAHGLSVGNAVLVLGTNKTSTVPCGINTYYPYPTVSQVISSTEFKYAVQNSVPDATCQAGGFGNVFPSPVTFPFSGSGSSGPFTLTTETVDTHLNDGTSLSSPYNVDPAGVTRGFDGTWERGAYEFVGALIGFGAGTGMALGTGVGIH